MSIITPLLEKLFILSEVNFRDGGTGTGDKIASGDPFVACDLTKQLAEKMDMPEPLAEIIEVFLNTSRNVGKIKNLGFNPGDSSWTFEILTGMFLYYALGGCVTTGTAGWSSTATAGTTGSNLEDTGQTFTSAMVGNVIIVTGGSDAASRYTITAFVDADNVTLDRAHSISSTDGYDRVVAPFTHTLSESDTLPSFAIHYEHFGIHEVDLIGCLVKSIEITFEAGSETPISCTVEIMASKIVEGDALTEPSAIELDTFVRKDVGTYSLTYNSTEIDTDIINQSDKLIIRIENTIDPIKVFNDEYVKRVKVGTRAYTVTYGTNIRNTTWRAIQNLKVPNYSSQYGTSGYYATAIASSTKVSRNASANDYIQIDFSKLYQKPSTELNNLISYDEKEAYASIEYGSAPGNVCSGVVVDGLNSLYYGRK